MKPKVLIVEDESTARKSMALLLADEGYEVLQAEDGPQALALTADCQPDLMSEFDIITAISGLEMTLSDLGFGIRPGAGVAAAQATFAVTRRA